nr:hypothetical protein [Piscinibacter sp.]
MTHKVAKVQAATGLLPPQVSASTAANSASSASSCQRIAASAWPARAQPRAPGGQAVRRGPVM